MPVRHSLFEILLLRTFATDLLSTCYWALYCCIMLVSGIASGVYPPSPTTKALFPLLPFLSHCLRFPPLYSFPTPMVVVSVSSLWRFWASRSRLDTVTPTSRYIISVSASYVSFCLSPKIMSGRWARQLALVILFRHIRCPIPPGRECVYVLQSVFFSVFCFFVVRHNDSA